MITPMKYLVVRQDGTDLFIIDEDQAFLNSHEFDATIDKIYQIGPEMRIKVSLEQVPVLRAADQRG